MTKPSKPVHGTAESVSTFRKPQTSLETPRNLFGTPFFAVQTYRGQNMRTGAGSSCPPPVATYLLLLRLLDRPTQCRVLVTLRTLCEIVLRLRGLSQNFW